MGIECPLMLHSNILFYSCLIESVTRKNNADGYLISANALNGVFNYSRFTLVSFQKNYSIPNIHFQ